MATIRSMNKMMGGIVVSSLNSMVQAAPDVFWYPSKEAFFPKEEGTFQLRIFGEDKKGSFIKVLPRVVE